MALFPLVLVVMSVIGLASGSNPHLVDEIARNLGLSGPAATTLRDTIAAAERRGAAGSVIGFIGMAWTGLGLVGALRYVVNLPRETTVRGFVSRLLGVPWLAGAALLTAASIALSSLVNWLPGWSAPVTIVVGLALDVVLFWWTFWFLDTERPAPRRVLPGAVAAAIGFEVLKVAGTVVVPRLVAGSSAAYGSLGVVFAILAWLLVFGRLIVYSVVFNAVIAELDAS